jgi:hypothetical protein
VPQQREHARLPPNAPSGPLPLWQVEGKVRRAGMDDIQVEYAWRRRTGAGVGSAPEVAYRGSAHLSEGGRALLDFVPAFEASSGCWQNLALELSASIPENPAFKDRRIGYDLWLVSDDHGKRLTRRLQLIGKQGEKVAFDYGILRSRLPVSPPPGKEAYVMETTVTGSVRSRLQNRRFNRDRARGEPWSAPERWPLVCGRVRIEDSARRTGRNSEARSARAESRRRSRRRARHVQGPGRTARGPRLHADACGLAPFDILARVAAGV